MKDAALSSQPRSSRRFRLHPSLKRANNVSSSEELSAYLNDLGSVETSFTQVNWDNSISTGLCG